MLLCDDKFLFVIVVKILNTTIINPKINPLLTLYDMHFVNGLN